MRVGFIGLGNMGLPMARNVARAGHELVVLDIVTEKVQALVAEGAAAAESPADLTARTDLILLSLPRPGDVREIFERPDGILSRLRPGQVVADLSTVDPGTSRAMAASCSAVGASYLDAPVSGGVAGAEQASLTIMVGGSADALEVARPVLQALGPNVEHVGESGTGSTVKLINQMLVGINLYGILEALTLGAKAGLDPARLHEIVSTSSGDSFILKISAPRVLQRNFDGGFSLDLLYKDVDLAAALGRELKLPLLMANQALQLIQLGRSKGLGSRDMSIGIQPLEELAQLQVVPKASRAADD